MSDASRFETPKLWWVAVEPTPYLNGMFTAIAESGWCDLHVVFLKRGTGQHPWRDSGAMDFKHSICARGYDLPDLVSLPKRSAAAGVVVGGWVGPTIPLLFRLAVARVPFAVWTDMPNVRRKRQFVKRVLRSAWLRFVFSNATVVMGTGIGALNVLEKMGCARRKLFNFPYPVDTQYFSQSRGSGRSGSGPLRILSVGRLVKSKAHDMAIGAITNLMEHGTDLPEVEYTIVGDGPERPTLEHLARHVPSTCRVNLAGWLEQKEILSLLHNADLFLHPSREEPYGVSVLEAMAAGLPVVVSDACGVTVDRVEHGINGLVHEAGNASDLTYQLSMALRNAALRTSMGQAARRTAEAWGLTRSVDLVMELVGHLTAAG